MSLYYSACILTVLVIISLLYISLKPLLDEFGILINEFNHLNKTTIQNIIDIFNSQFMMNSSGSEGNSSLGGFGGGESSTTGGSNTTGLNTQSDENYINIKPQDIPLFKDILAKPLPENYVPSTEDFDHLYKTVTTLHEEIKSEYQSFYQSYNKNIGMDKI
jgi:hypothetical protein